VGAPAFMRGEERFSAPGDSLDSIVRFSAGGDRPPQRLKPDLFGILYVRPKGRTLQKHQVFPLFEGDGLQAVHNC
jgi:hypothetical protein